jgi:hypothetical protein
MQCGSFQIEHSQGGFAAWFDQNGPYDDGNREAVTEKGLPALSSCLK